MSDAYIIITMNWESEQAQIEKSTLATAHCDQKSFLAFGGEKLGVFPSLGCLPSVSPVWLRGEKFCSLTNEINIRACVYHVTPMIN